jgi:hypothetical protein
MRADPKANTPGLPTPPALASPLNGIVEIAGPDQFRLDELIHRALRARNDPRDVTTDHTQATSGSCRASAPSSPETAHASPRPDSPTGSAAPRLSSDQRRA